MRMTTLAAVVGGLVAMGPAVGAVAQEKPWQTLQAVQATALNEQEMDAVTGKSIGAGNLFEFTMMNGNRFDFSDGSVVFFWASLLGQQAIISGPFGTFVAVFQGTPS